MEFVLTGFRQDINVRQYTFEAVAEDRQRTRVTVGADLALIRKYKIPLQELPLLCRRLLEGNGAATKSSSLMFTEKEMLGYAKNRAAAEEVAAQKRRAHRVPVSRRAAGWRSR